MTVDNEVSEKLVALRTNVEKEAIVTFEAEILPRIVEIARYTNGDAHIVATVTSTDDELLHGKVNVSLAVGFSEKYPDPFQIAQRIIVQELFNSFLSRQ